MTAIFVVCGKVNYTNLSRYSHLCEKTYRRQFNAGLSLEPLNSALIEEVAAPESEQIAAVDCTFVEKSGRYTHGVDWFFNGKTQRAERGIEWSVIAIIDLAQHTGYTLSAQQTEAGLPAKPPEPSRLAKDSPSSTSRVDFYVGHLVECDSYLPERVRYIVADGFYSKRKWINAVVQINRHAIGKLRCDANLKFLYRGPQKRQGRRRRYAAKVELADPSNLTFVCELESGDQLYTAVVWSVSLKRAIRMAYVCRHKDGKRSYAVLFSTDLDIDPYDIYRYYTARFQIEFIFRDARLFTGLTHCQARNANALDSHVNASLLALNLAKAAWRRDCQKAEPSRFSIASFKRWALNEHLLELFIDMFELDPTLIKSHINYQKLLKYGAIDH